jgi:uncharacterized Zn finger protein
LPTGGPEYQPTPGVEAKAARLLLTGCVAILEAWPAHVLAEVQGDHDRYRVAFDRRWRCDCPTLPGRACSHALAVSRVVDPPGVGPATEDPDHQEHAFACGARRPPLGEGG